MMRVQAKLAGVHALFFSCVFTQKQLKTYGPCTWVVGQSMATTLCPMLIVYRQTNSEDGRPLTQQVMGLILIGNHRTVGQFTSGALRISGVRIHHT